MKINVQYDFQRNKGNNLTKPQFVQKSLDLRDPLSTIWLRNYKIKLYDFYNCSRLYVN